MLQPVRANVQKLLNQLAGETKSHATVDVLRYCNFFSFDNITGLLYGPEHGARTIDDRACMERSILEEWMQVEIWNNLQYNFPLVHKAVRKIVSYCTQNVHFLSAEDRLADWNLGKIDVARQQPGMADSLLQRLFDAKNPDGEPYTKSWIAAELLDNIHAAQSTVALALTYALWNLASVPQWQEEIRHELAVLPLEDDGLPSFDSIQAAPILEACIRESSRLNPLSSGRAERVVPVTDRYDGIWIPAGTIVSTSTRSIHHRPDVFPDPESYKPERWLESDEATLRIMDSCYMPFGYGARLCQGKPFALAEIKLLIAGLLTKFEVGIGLSSGTTPQTMQQLGTQNALPRGQRCDLSLKPLA